MRTTARDSGAVSPHALPVKWRAEADAYKRDGVPGHAALLRRVAEELEAAWREHELEALTLEQAAEESGYSYSALQKKIASGELPNAGSKHRPRVRRRDLPKKGARGGLQLVTGEPDLAGERLRSEFHR